MEAPRGDNGILAGQGADSGLLGIQEGRRPPQVQYLLEQSSLPLLNEQVHIQKQANPYFIPPFFIPGRLYHLRPALSPFFVRFPLFFFSSLWYTTK